MKVDRKEFAVVVSMRTGQTFQLEFDSTALKII